MGRTTGEYAQCTCGGWARIWRGEKGYRDRMICSKCGSITVYDNLVGQPLRLKELQEKRNIAETESEDDSNGQG